jgi:hypothetical protein
MMFIGDGAARYDNIVTGGNKYFDDGPNQTVFVSGLYPSTGWSCDNSLDVSGTNATVTYTVDGATDIMYAQEKETTLGKDPPTLVFAHLLTLLEIQLEKVGNADITVNSITLVGVGAEEKEGEVVHLPVHATCKVALNTPLVTFCLDANDTEIDCYEMDGSTYTDDIFRNQAYILTTPPALKIYVLAPALESTEVNSDKDYTFRVTYTLGTGGPITVDVPVNLKSGPNTDFEGVTAGNRFDITMRFFGGDITTNATIAPWEKGDDGISLELPPVPPPTPQPTTGTVDGMSNCYIVDRNKTLRFRVSRAYKYDTALGAFTKILHIGDEYDGCFNAEVLWEDADVIDGTPTVTGTGYNALVEIKTNSDVEGNAVVKIYKTEDLAKIPVWSYHIWVTDYAPDYDDTTWTNPENKDYTFMVRNLGATESVLSYKNIGLLYQWGRKDPFPGGGIGAAGYAALNSFKGMPDAGSTALCKVNNQSATAEALDEGICQSILNPNTFYALINGSVNYWLPILDLKLWNSEGDTKTIYDPCPPGWRVPVYILDKNLAGQWDQVSAWVGLVGKIYSCTTLEQDIKVIHNVAGSQNWIISGYRTGVNGAVKKSSIATIACHWTARTLNDTQLYPKLPKIEVPYLRLSHWDFFLGEIWISLHRGYNDYDGVAGYIEEQYNADAYHVRCCKEYAMN